MPRAGTAAIGACTRTPGESCTRTTSMGTGVKHRAKITRATAAKRRRRGSSG